MDAGAPFLELSGLAGYLMDIPDPENSVPGAGLLVGIGSVSAPRCVVVVDDSGIEAGALQPMGLEKFQRAEQLAHDDKLPPTNRIVQWLVRVLRSLYETSHRRHQAAAVKVWA